MSSDAGRLPKQISGEFPYPSARKADLQSGSQPVSARSVHILKVTQRRVHLLQILVQTELLDQLEIFPEEGRRQPAQHQSQRHRVRVQTTPKGPVRELSSRATVTSTECFLKRHRSSVFGSWLFDIRSRVVVQ